MTQSEQMGHWLEDRIAKQKLRCQELERDHRRDEAAFAKISGNVYGIFLSVLSAANTLYQGETASIAEFCKQRLRQIPTGWEASLQQAQIHGDTHKMHIEQLKLDTVREIENAFHTFMEKPV